MKGYYSRRHLITVPIITLGSLFIAVGFNMLLVPHQLLSGGVSGISMIIGYISGGNIGWLYLLLNLPILIWGWYMLGRKFVLWSVYSVLTVTFFLQLVPIKPIVEDILLGAVFGGIMIGFGTGLALRRGGSSGGFDIIASIITRKHDLPVGMIIFILNGSVISMLVVFTKNWDLALYSLAAIFTTGKIIDMIHVRHLKVTAFIITTKTDEMVAELLTHPRGITIISTKGAYSTNDSSMLMTVRTKYELAELGKTITSIDPHAFVNIVETVGVIGEFRKQSPT